ncbi:adenosine 5'-monophosphoramidase HINT3-like [Calliphora vicina]|uniref:adenosine 5'-monophosphoramidase HINT3-like n=1 Tax=Calliphora vicina TaxID=7373 RepID=UPI00325AA377
MAGCIFCNIVAGKSPNTKIEVETEEYVIFKDIKPVSTYHYLCVTKRHIRSIEAMTKKDIPLVNRMEEGLNEFFKSQNIDFSEALIGFHLPPNISVNHLHMHGIAPHSKMSRQNSFLFKIPSSWFKTVEETRQYLVNIS